MKRLTVAVWWIAFYLTCLACVALLLTGAVMVVQLAASSPWGAAWLLAAALCATGYLCWARGRERDRVYRRLWDAQVDNQELMEQRNAARRQVEAYRNASDEYFEKLLDSGEI